MTILQQLRAWANEHPLQFFGLIAYALANVLHRLWPTPKKKRGFLAALHSLLDLLVFLGQRGSPDLFAFPGRRSRPPGPRAVPPSPPHGFTRLAVLLVLTAIALMALPLLGGCATESHSTTVSHSEGTETGEAHSQGHAQLDEHVEDHGTERLDENVVTNRSGGALDVEEYFPDGKLKRKLHRGPVETQRNAQKTAAVQNAMTADAKALLDNEADAKTQAKKSSEGVKEGGQSMKPDLPMSCALLGGGGGLLLLLAVGFVLWRMAKRARGAAAVVKGVVDAVGPLP